jgi:hypothetical protein
MIYLNSNYLSKVLGINLSKWKRWSREFLDPDPLGGYQSGYPRQFSTKDAFRVYLGGFLVADLKFTIPEARQILSDLNVWLKKKRMYSVPVRNIITTAESYHIYIYRMDQGKFGYTIRHIANQPFQTNGSLCQEHFDLEFIGFSETLRDMDEFTHARVVYINTLYQKFLSRVNS